MAHLPCQVIVIHQYFIGELDLAIFVDGFSKSAKSLRLNQLLHSSPGQSTLTPLTNRVHLFFTDLDILKIVSILLIVGCISTAAHFLIVNFISFKRL